MWQAVIFTLTVGLTLASAQAVGTNQTSNCSDEFKACRGKFHSYDSPSYLMAQELFHCMKRPQNCLGWEEDFRSEINHMANDIAHKTCPSCPALLRTPMQNTTAAPVPSCLERIMKCKNVFDESDESYDSMEKYYACINRPTGCADYEERIRQSMNTNLLQAMKNVCPQCTTPTPSTSTNSTTPGPTPPFLSCLEMTRMCSRNYESTPKSYLTMEQYYSCLTQATGCSTQEQTGIDAIVSDVVNAMNKSASAGCDNEIEVCEGGFQNLSSNFNEIEEYFYCLWNLTGCTADQNSTRRQISNTLINLMKEKCANCSRPTLPSNTSSPVTTPSGPTVCSDYMWGCYLELIGSTQGNYSAMQKYYMCIWEAKNCSASDASKRLSSSWNALLDIKKGCPECALPSIPTTFNPVSQVPPTPSSMTCSATLVTCALAMSASYDGMENYLYCIWNATNCSSYEKDVIQNASTSTLSAMRNTCLSCILPRVPHQQQSTTDWPTTSTHVNCYDAISNCSMKFNSSSYLYSDIMEVYNCLMEISNCNSWEEEIRRNTSEGILAVLKQVCPSCPVPSNPRTSPASTVMTTTDGISCMDFIDSCTRTFDRSDYSLAALNQYQVCVLKPGNCSNWDHRRRIQLLEIIEANIRQKCPSCLSNTTYAPTSTTPKPTSCRSKLTMCARDYEWRYTSVRSKVMYIDCIMEPMSCSFMEDVERRNIVRTLLHFITNNIGTEVEASGGSVTRFSSVILFILTAIHVVRAQN